MEKGLVEAELQGEPTQTFSLCRTGGKENAPAGLCTASRPWAWLEHYCGGLVLKFGIGLAVMAVGR